MDMEYVNINEFNDLELATRMRTCNYEKFKSLVRMHLSFELELNTDEFDLACHEIVYEDKGKLKKWNRLSKKHRLGHTGAAAGVAGCTAGAGSKSLGNSPTEGLQQQIDPGFQLHMLELKEFLMLDKNITQEGLFRKGGAVSRQNELRLHIQQDKPLELEQAGFSAHDCATVFKSFLAELPEPLMTDAHYPAHLQIAPLCQALTQPTQGNLERQLHLLHSVQLLLLLLPEEHRDLLKHIMEMLHAVALHEDSNKMSADNLATLFAPHLICPRNLPPEVLHYTAKRMCSIVAYMIVRGLEIFAVPAKLSTDIRAYFLERKRKKTMSPEQTLDESISDISTVNTVYTFVDRAATAAATNSNNTDTELAQLYAHIQSLPESSKKRRLIKQFNKQNGQGTPLQLVVMNRLKNNEATRSAKSLGDSIKKHIFHKSLMSRTPKRAPALPAMSGAEQSSRYKSEPNLCSLAPQVHDEDAALTPIAEISATATNHGSGMGKSLTRKLMKGVSMGNLRFPFSTPETTKRLVRSVSATLKRRPSGSDEVKQEHADAPLLEDVDDSDVEEDEDEKPADDDDEDTLSEVNGSSSELPGAGYHQQLLQSSVYRNLDLITSTPAMHMGRRSMSPITKSTQRMPKSMQESIMTPRSRKPVMLLAALGNIDKQQQQLFAEPADEDADALLSSKQLEPPVLHSEDATSLGGYAEILRRQQSFMGGSLLSSRQRTDSSSNSNSNEVELECKPHNALSHDFKEYLLSRSVLTASPADLSFASRSDDFGGANTTQDLEDFDESELSPSLLYCLDGNEPATASPLGSFNNGRKRSADTPLKCALEPHDDQNKENISSSSVDADEHLRTKKLLITSHVEYPGETAL
ncbi:rho GTPase-activating protein 21 isoform X2 [Drosophila busckii]|uniref:rho GTPase-activating protein 21 isoform X2 n=1 Tax=Drosophila busckii TaxID=30019 RepID=UPI00083EF6D1|nr:rho GTPase-activating protein 21 isoform X2 [Drosophila busckii]